MKRLTDARLKPGLYTEFKSRATSKEVMLSEKPSIQQVYDRLLSIENILGDHYDLAALQRLVNLSKSLKVQSDA